MSDIAVLPSMRSRASSPSAAGPPPALAAQIAGDPLFVFDLREGREPRSDTRARILKAMQDEGEAPALPPLRIGVAGLGNVGATLVRILQKDARRAHAQARPAADRSPPWRPARAARTAASTSPPLAWFDDPVALAKSPDIDLFVELIGGEDGPACAAVRAALEIGRPVVTANKALLARHGVALARSGGGNRRPARLRGGRRRWHPGDQDPARGAGLGPHRPRLWHHERHLQLHPDPHGRGGNSTGRLRRVPQGGAGARLCRGRPELRRRGLRHRPQARDPGSPLLWLRDRRRRRLRRRHHQHHPGRYQGRRRSRLRDQAARRRPALGRGHRAARPSDTGAEEPPPSPASTACSTPSPSRPITSTS